ncbi:MAG TPA: DbpA RNA binding domain-containing protein, partial [Promineifilum sp.]|nr:DbpA RNA binding domain-containing protein [Promineifilum sp.]
PSARAARPPQRAGGGAEGGRRGSDRGAGPSGGGGRTRGRGATAWQVARIRVGAGRAAGVRPADLVGAIANEAGVSPRLIGAIEIADRFAIDEGPDEIADAVVAALGAATVRG